jgi:hypothetical protein
LIAILAESCASYRSIAPLTRHAVKCSLVFDRQHTVDCTGNAHHGRSRKRLLGPTKQSGDAFVRDHHVASQPDRLFFAVQLELISAY